MTDFIQKFIDHMLANGCGPALESDIVADDKRHLIVKEGDSRKHKRLYYQFAISGNFSYGWYKDCSTGQSFSYSYKNGDSEYSAEEISRLKAAREEARKQDDIRRVIHEKRLSRLLKKAINGMSIAESHPYLESKGVQAHGLKLREKRNELIVPMYRGDGSLGSIQRIVMKAGGKSWKGMWKGVSSAGLYYPLANKGEDLSLLFIGEGFSTCATVREAMDAPVVCAFDAGNLMPVAKILRQKYPESRIVFVADNDQWKFNPKRKPSGLKSDEIPGDSEEWTRLRAEGFTYNTGIDKAKQAAAAIGGALIITPDYIGNEPGKPTDFNDLAKDKGLEYVNKLISKVLLGHLENEIPVMQEPPADFVGTPDSVVSYDAQTGGGNELETYGDFGMNFRALGYNNGEFYYFPFGARQIIGLSAAGHSMANLLQLDTLNAWETRFGGEKVTHQKVALLASNGMMQLCRARGVFKEEDFVRGCGAWQDEGSVILHCGDALYVDGVKTPFADVKSDYTYVAAAKLMKPSDKPLKNAEAFALRDICESITWENKLSGSLLAGWLVVAPICASLAYRPHIYITGQAESGKSTVFNKIIKPVVGRIALQIDGGSTEPAIREMMGYDARPLVLDEGETSQSMMAIIELARKASTGSVVKKFGQRPFKARFCACFGAINPPVNKTADESRISFMNIKKNTRATAMQEYEELLAKISGTITPDYSNRLLARTILNMDALQANIITFEKAFRRVTKGARAAQQIGTMLAGLYLLSRTDVATLEVAEEWVRKYEWNDHTMLDQETDPIRLVQHISGSIMRLAGGREAVIGDLISKVHTSDDAESHKSLRHAGICVKDGRVIIANRSQNLARILSGTDWEVRWARTLSDLTGSEKEKSFYFFPGFKTSATSIPISMFIEDAPVRNIPVSEMPAEWDEQEIPFD